MFITIFQSAWFKRQILRSQMLNVCIYVSFKTFDSFLLQRRLRKAQVFVTVFEVVSFKDEF